MQGEPPRPLLARDAGLKRASRLTRWLAAGGLVLTGLFAKVAAQSFSGHSAKAATPAARSAPAAPAAPAPVAPDQSSPADDSSSGDSSSSEPVRSDPSAQDPGLQAPAEVPQPSSSSDGAVSGGSCPCSARWRALGTDVAVFVERDDSLEAARRVLEEELEALDLAASRFRPDSELWAISRGRGRWVEVGPLCLAASRPD